MKILVVDDEPSIREAITYTLKKEGYDVSTADDAQAAVRVFFDKVPDLVLLDVMLPSGSGFDVCRRIRAKHNVPIIFLTARADEIDRVVGLELGADDYITKPFGMRELIARVKAVLRRATPKSDEPERKRVEVGDLVIDESRHIVGLAGKRIDLSPKEFSLLQLLASHPDQVFTRQQLLDRVWGLDAYVEERTIDVHVRWLREKIESDPSTPTKLLTVRGFGYKFSSGAPGE